MPLTLSGNPQLELSFANIGYRLTLTSGAFLFTGYCMFIEQIDSPISQRALLMTGHVALLLVNSGPLRPALAIGVIAPETLQ